MSLDSYFFKCIVRLFKRCLFVEDCKFSSFNKKKNFTVIPLYLIDDVHFFYDDFFYYHFVGICDPPLVFMD